MRFCRMKGQLAGTCYFEFQKGWQRERFWKDDSLYLSDEDFDQLGLAVPFFRAIPGFDCCGPTLVSAAQWDKLLAESAGAAPDTREALEEIDEWARECFRQEPGFSVLGI